jgi:hypothetical protein
MGDYVTNIIPFPHPHRGDSDPRREALTGIGVPGRAAPGAEGASC